MHRERLVRRAAHAAVSLLLLTAACTTTGRTTEGPVALPTSPRSPGPPSVFPEPILSPRVDQAPMDFAVSVRVSPISGLRIGSVVTLLVVVTNLGPPRSDPQMANFVIGASEVVWAVVTPPRGGRSQGRACNERLTGEQICGTAGFDVPFTIRVGETKTVTLVVRAKDLVCPGGGDFISEFFVGIAGSLKRRTPASYRVLYWFENDPQDYADSLAASSRPKPWPPLCRSHSIDVDQHGRPNSASPSISSTS